MKVTWAQSLTTEKYTVVISSTTKALKMLWSSSHWITITQYHAIVFVNLVENILYRKKAIISVSYMERSSWKKITPRSSSWFLPITDRKKNITRSTFFPPIAFLFATVIISYRRIVRKISHFFELSGKKRKKNASWKRCNKNVWKYDKRVNVPSL